MNARGKSFFRFTKVLLAAVMFAGVLAFLRPSTAAAQQPYFQVYGGDIMAGSGFYGTDGGCVDNSARIIGWNQGGPNYVGAGAQLAAFAFGQIDDFSTGQMRTSGASKPLTFANTDPSRGGVGLSTTYGGGLEDGYGVCAPNYFADHVNVSDDNEIEDSDLDNSAPCFCMALDVGNLPNGTYFRNGNMGILGPGNNVFLERGSGTRVIYVKGDVNIVANVFYDSANPGYISTDAIPGLRLIVQGNIYIRQVVTHLSGMFVAQPDPARPNTGRIYTCTQGSVPPHSGQLNGVCGDPGSRLRIYGSVIADAIKMGRSIGDVGAAADTPFDPWEESGDNTAAAEIFVMTPEAWLTSDFGGSGSFDALTTLPPIL